MKRSLVLASIVSILALCGGPAAAEWEGDVNVFLGQKTMDLPSELEPVDQPFQYGLTISFGVEEWPVDIATDIFWANKEATGPWEIDPGIRQSVTIADFTLDSREVDIGVRKFFEASDLIDPYIGGGFAWSELEARVSGETNPGGKGGQVGFNTVSRESGWGYWLDAGVLFRIGPRFNVGLDLRYSDIQVEMFRQFDFGQEEINAGGFQVGLLLGWRWGIN